MADMANSAETADTTKRRGIGVALPLAGLVVLGLLAWTIAFQVEFTEFVLVQTFGKTTAVFDGAKDAGLHVKWPFPIQQVVRYDARTFIFEDAMTELQTSDKQNILVTTFCAWRIQDPVKFQASIGSVRQAEDAGLRPKLRSAKSAVFGRHNLADLVNTDPGRMQIPAVEEEILAYLAVEAMRDYGVQVVLVGIKSLGLPESVSGKVIEAMRDERQREVATFEAAGQAQAQAIRERARSAAEQILAFAHRKAEEIRTEGDRAAAGWYKEFEKDWQLAAYLRSLESLRKELEARTVFLLDGSEIPAVKYFRDGPSLPTTAPATKEGGGG